MRRNSGWKLDNREIKNLAFKSAPMDTELPEGAAAVTRSSHCCCCCHWAAAAAAAISGSHPRRTPRPRKNHAAPFPPSLEELVPEIELRVRNMCVFLIVSLSREKPTWKWTTAAEILWWVDAGDGVSSPGGGRTPSAEKDREMPGERERRGNGRRRSPATPWPARR